MKKPPELQAAAAQHNGSTFPLVAAPGPDLVTLLLSTRRALHACPELGYQEVKTARFLRELLQSNGLEIRGPVAGTGFYVDIEGALPGSKIGYRADMDALPVSDVKQVPYASKNNGVTHACGHDAHMAIGVGVALTLHRLRQKLHGAVRVFFQPNEEGAPSGSVPMIRDGILDGLEAAYCIHVDPTLDVGTYGLIDGTVTAATDRFHVRVSTQATGHSARPHQAKDSIWIATLLLQQFYQLIGRITDARNAAVLTVCIFKGGTAHNVIPSEVEFEGSLRFLDEQDRKSVKQFLRRVTEQFAGLHGVKIELSFRSALPSVVNNHQMVGHVRNTIRLLFSGAAIQEISTPSMGSEDFANYLRYVPGLLLRVGTRGGVRTSYPLHDKQFDIDEKALAPAVQLMSSVLMGHLQQVVLQ